MKRFRAFGRADLQNIMRESMLLLVTVGPLALALVVRIATPWLGSWLLAEYQIDIVPLYPLLMSLVVSMAPGLAGMLVGLLLLDERDDRTLIALMVTPVPLWSYLLYRLGTPILFSLLFTPLAVWIAGLIWIPLGELLLVVLLAGFSGTTAGLLLVALAQNKVMGIGVIKVIQGLQVLPLGAYFIPLPWQLLAGIVPSYWPLAIYWRMVTGEPYWGFWLAGLAVNVAFLIYMTERFDRGLRR